MLIARPERPSRCSRRTCSGRCSNTRRQPALRGAVRADAGRARAAREAPLPETVHGIIAARIDSLPAEEKALDPTRGRRRQGVLERRGGGVDDENRSSRGASASRSNGRSSSSARTGSSVEGETEYAFRHLLVRDVAYGQLPRADRAREAPSRRRVDRVSWPSLTTTRRLSRTTTRVRSSSSARRRGCRRAGRPRACCSRERRQPRLLARLDAGRARVLRKRPRTVARGQPRMGATRRALPPPRSPSTVSTRSSWRETRWSPTATSRVPPRRSCTWVGRLERGSRQGRVGTP